MRLSAPLVSTCMVPIMALMPRQWNCAFASSPCPPCHASLKGVVTYGHTGILSVQPRVWYPIFSSDMLHIWMNLGKTRCPQGSCLRGAGSLQLMTTKIKKRHPHKKQVGFLHVLSREMPCKVIYDKGWWESWELFPLSWTPSFFYDFTLCSTFTVLTSPTRKVRACLTKSRDRIFF